MGFNNNNNKPASLLCNCFPSRCEHRQKAGNGLLRGGSAGRQEAYYVASGIGAYGGPPPGHQLGSPASYERVCPRVAFPMPI